MLRGNKHWFGWHRGVLPVCLRVVMLAVAVPGLVISADRVDAHARAVRVYRLADPCPVGTPWATAHHCIAQTVAEVVDRKTQRWCSTDSDGTGSCTTDHLVAVSLAGQRRWLGVDKRTYKAVDRGDRVDLRLWRGEVVQMRAGGHTERFLTSSQEAFFMWLILGWALLAMCGPAIFGLWLFRCCGGWLLLVLPYLMVADNRLLHDPMNALEWTFTIVVALAGVWLMGRTLSRAKKEA
ncbi:hypothetical protein ACFZBU_36410 [Embleya sp. NPDC008237]|uniref:hypothetical protein n=1 Tax=Embleya sp. NPDC008237 TaxID=3363978 RepID=UPI0036EB35B8